MKTAAQRLSPEQTAAFKAAVHLYHLRITKALEEINANPESMLTTFPPLNMNVPGGMKDGWRDADEARPV